MVVSRTATVEKRHAFEEHIAITNTFIILLLIMEKNTIVSIALEKLWIIKMKRTNYLAVTAIFIECESVNNLLLWSHAGE